MKGVTRGVVEGLPTETNMSLAIYGIGAAKLDTGVKKNKKGKLYFISDIVLSESSRRKSISVFRTQKHQI
mgnify:CR=1 FL=1